MAGFCHGMRRGNIAGAVGRLIGGAAAVPSAMAASAAAWRGKLASPVWDEGSASACSGARQPCSGSVTDLAKSGGGAVAWHHIGAAESGNGGIS